jgi:SAM-dependent methyltransferase
MGALLSVDELAREYVVSFYDRALALHGDRPEAVCWTERGQQERFSALLAVSPSLEGSKILDFGSGKGDFYAFLRARGITVDYTGMDINEGLIALARRKFPEGRFIVFNGEIEGISEDFDYIFLCGVFNLKVQGLDELIEGTLRGLFRRCRRALAFNALSAHTPRKEFDLHYVRPEDLHSFAARELSPRVSLRQDLLPHDLVLFVYRAASEGRAEVKGRVQTMGR